LKSKQIDGARVIGDSNPLPFVHQLARCRWKKTLDLSGERNYEIENLSCWINGRFSSIALTVFSMIMIL
jgi:hypothetical protein